MLYRAKHYFGIAGQVIRPGDVFEPELEAEALERLIALGAIEPCAAAPDRAVEPEGEADEPEGVPEAVEAGESAEAELFDDGPAPVIDISDGIVEAPKKPRRGRGKSQ